MASILKSLKLLSDSTRLRILMILESESLSVADMQEILGMGQSRISTQLSLLKAAGLVSDERSGKRNVYSCTADTGLLKVARLAAGEVAEASKDRTALRHLLRKRKDSSRAYFDELAGRFGKDYVPGRSWKGLAEALLKNPETTSLNFLIMFLIFFEFFDKGTQGKAKCGSPLFGVSNLL